ncbi:MAG: ester cyclase, partial [Anaerolineae bacterium]|nr:ester cyclase [Anaerolineae bacterium]
MRHTLRAILAFGVILSLVGGMSVSAQEDNAQRNKELIRSAFADLSNGDPSTFYALFPDQFMMNQGDPVLAPMSGADVQAYNDSLMSAMPDLQMVPDVIIAQGDWVAVPVTLSGTFTQPYSFAPITTAPVEPNNQPIRWTETDFIRFDEAGLISEVWGISDPTVQFGQMGIFPMEGGDAPAEGTSMTEPV